jgi:multiple sugar transport system substrate-binding protein
MRFRGGSCRRVSRVITLLVVALLAAPLLASCAAADDGDGVVLRLYTPADGATQYAQAAQDCTAAAAGRYRIQQVTLPRQADDQRLQLARRIVGGDNTIDILGMDVTWTAEFAEAEWIRPFPSYAAAAIREGTLKTAYDTGTWQDRLYAAPLNTNTQLLWYRADLMPAGRPPSTWDELIGIAGRLAAADRPSWVEVQAAQYEGLSVWFNTLLTSAGGQIAGEDGKVRLGEGDAAVRALDIIRRVATTPGADPSLSQRNEGTTRLAMESGKAAFMVNYPFVLPGIAENGGGASLDDNGKPTPAKETGRKVQDVLRWAPYPAVTPGKPASVTIGGLNLAVSRTTRYPTQAVAAVQCLRNRSNQLRNALDGGVPPTLEALYADPAFQRAYPAWEAIKQSLDTASVRPKSPAYQSISTVISALLNPPAEIDPQTTRAELDRQVTRAVNSEGLVP